MTDWIDRAKARMTFLKLTQSDLMEAFGVATRGAVGHYLSRRRSPTPDQLIALAAVLRMTVGELMAGEAVAVTHEEDLATRSPDPGRLNADVLASAWRALFDAFAQRNELFDMERDTQLLCALYELRVGGMPEDAMANVASTFADMTAQDRRRTSPSTIDSREEAAKEARQKSR